MRKTAQEAMVHRVGKDGDEYFIKFYEGSK